MKLSIALIVKNEAKILDKCLESVKDADELIVVDTGSSDDTIKIAKKYTDKIYHFKWIDSFCKARNFANSKATGDWIMSIDADEYLVEPISEVKKWLEAYEGDSAKVKIEWQGTGDYHYLPKLYRNREDIYWKGDIHNYITKGSEIISPFTFKTIYSPAHSSDPDRALRIAKKAVTSDPKLVRERYYLAREYYYRKRYIECIFELDEYLVRSDYRAEMADAHLMKARCYWQLQKGELARQSCLQAIYTNPDFKEALRFMAQMNYEPRKSQWNAFANMASNSDVLFIRQQAPMSMRREHINYVKDLLKSYKSVSVLEWGSGYSTKFYPEFMQESGVDYTWTALEHDKKWYGDVVAWQVKNVKVILADKDSDAYLKPEGKFDVIFVDGRNRVKCLNKAKQLLKKDGLVILHDAERERYQAGFKGYSGAFIGLDSPRLWVGKIK